MEDLGSNREGETCPKCLQGHLEWRGLVDASHETNGAQGQVYGRTHEYICDYCGHSTKSLGADHSATIEPKVQSFEMDMAENLADQP
jgi:hypothetical protein